MSIRQTATSLIAAAIMTLALPASALEPAEGPVVLTVTGAITQTNAEGAAKLDLALLSAMGSVVVETTTIWTDGVQTFEGVELATLLAALGAEGTVLRAIAHNDYAVDIPVSDAVAGGPVVAYLRNGAAMSMRDKGPLWVVYPYDTSPEYQSELIYSRSIWQLDRIEVQP
jgi:hypothetical protein